MEDKRKYLKNIPMNTAILCLWITMIFPSADGNLDDVNRPSRSSLKNAYDDNLLFVFKTCHNHIHVNDGLQKQAAFFELLKVIFCKIEDERNIPKPLEFYATSDERSNPDGQLTVNEANFKDIRCG